VPQRCASTSARTRSPSARPSSFPAIAAEPPTADRGRRYRAVVALSPRRRDDVCMRRSVFAADGDPARRRRCGQRALRRIRRRGFATLRIPAPWIRAVMRAESFGNARAISARGAIGLMQIMPDTWASLRVRYKLGVDPYDTTTTSWLVRPICASCTIVTAFPASLAAYNAGPARWEDHLATGRQLPAETRAYIARSRANRRRNFSRRHGHPRCGGEVLDGGVTVSITHVEVSRATLHLRQRCNRLHSRTARSAQDWTCARAAVRWAVRRSPLEPERPQ